MKEKEMSGGQKLKCAFIANQMRISFNQATNYITEESNEFWNELHNNITTKIMNNIPF